MVTIEGNAKKPGIAIAVAAIFDTLKGIGGVSPALLQEGVNALKRGAALDDFPEAIVITDNLALGIALKIPGIQIIGLAAQAGDEIPTIELDVPCVTGLPDLLRSVSEGDLVIVDGNNGIVHIDPDPQTISRYQQIDESTEARITVFISSEHIPARTQAGEIVYVYAIVTSKTDLARALDEGADGLLVNATGAPEEFTNRVAAAAGGKPVALEPFDPNTGDEITVMGRHIENLADVIAAGTRSIAVLPELVEVTKMAIRSIGLEEVEG